MVLPWRCMCFTVCALSVGSAGLRTKCRDDFEASLEDFMTYSMFPFKITPDVAIQTQVQQFFHMEDDIPPIQARKYMEWAHQMLMACWSLHGRAWELRLRWNASVVMGGKKEEDLNEIHSTICAPVSCQRRHIIREIGPRVYFNNPEAYSSFVGHAEVLSSWKFVDVQFAIVGTGGCGTSSLRKNLERHPHVRFTHTGEDYLYAPGYNHHYVGGFRMLPTEAQVNMLKCGKSRCTAEDVSTPRVNGVKNYDLYNFDVGLAALSMKKMKVIILLCDPVDRLEKVLYYQHCQFNSSCENRSVIDEIVARKDVAQLVHENSHFWKVFDRLLLLHSLFETTDVITVHQEVLREKPETLYPGLFHKIGVEPISTMKYYRWNSLGGRRSGLCLRRKLLKEFQEVMEPEYQNLEEALVALKHPKVNELHKRRTRCHRPAEMRQRRCVNQRCE